MTESTSKRTSNPTSARTSRSRFLWLVASAGLLSAGSIGACSSSSDVGGGFDAGTDGTTTDAGPGDGSPGKEAGPKDGGMVQPGSCPAATLAGECDLVLQNCDGGLECDPVIEGSDIVAACQPASTGSTPLGHECCSNGPNNGNCVAGLFCNAPCANADAGAGTKSGRCSPYCCMGDDKKCGESDPEGIKGTCSVTQVGVGANPQDGGDVTFGSGCVYATSCKPFDIQPCTDPSSICAIQADNVTFRCEGLFKTPATAAGAPCSLGNECIDGTECLGGLTDGGSVCTYTCYQPINDGGPPPFDASVITTAPGQGGCPAGQTCNGFVDGWPKWFGVCNP